MSAEDELIGIAIGGQYVELSPADLVKAQKNLQEAATAAGVSREAARKAALVEEENRIRNEMERYRTSPVCEHAPAEVWALRRLPDDDEDDAPTDGPRRLVHPGSEEDGHPFIGFRSFEDAVEGAIEHSMRWNFKLYPVRLK